MIHTERCTCCGKPLPHALLPFALRDTSGRLWDIGCAERRLAVSATPPSRHGDATWTTVKGGQ
jgi:hypothetical protein